MPLVFLLAMTCMAVSLSVRLSQSKFSKAIHAIPPPLVVEEVRWFITF